MSLLDKQSLYDRHTKGNLGNAVAAGFTGDNFASAGVSLDGLSFSSLLDKVPLGIVLGLFLGKQLGVFVFSYISIKLKIAQMPNNSNWFNFYGVGVLTGIGFTMSLFVGNLAFVENMQYMDGVKIGVLTGSLLSTLFGYFLILLTPNK